MPRKTNLLQPYYRQSRRRERTITFEEQDEIVQRWAAQHPEVTLLPPIIERGVSGSKPWREREIGTAIEACEHGRAGGIVVPWQDRLSRENGLATAEVWEAMDRGSFRLVCVEDNVDTATGDHELLFQIRAAIARDMWKRSRARFENAKRKAVVERGIHVGPIPFGYARPLDPENPEKHLPNTPLLRDRRNSRAVSRAFELRASGATIAEVCALLDKLAPGGPSGHGVWNRNTVTRLLKNRVYLGEARGGEGYVHPAAHPALTDQETFDTVQALFRRADPATQPPVKGAPTTMLGGIARCGGCGYALDRQLIAKKYVALRCRKRSATGVCPAPTAVMVHALDEHVRGEIRARFAAARPVEIEQVAVGANVEALHAQLAKARHKRTPFEDPDYVAALGIEAAKRGIAKVDEEIAEIETKLAGAIPRGLQDVSTQLVTALLVDEELPDAGWRALAGALLAAVVVSRGARGDSVASRTRIFWKGDELPFRLPVRSPWAKVEAGVDAA
jgi:DNA invertase Pin-like site-specific DNA recombinase